MRASRPWLLTGVLLAVSACGGPSPGEPAGEEMVAENLAEDVETDPPSELQLPATPQEFANRLAAVNRYEVEAATIAAERAASPEVKAFAEQVIAHHRSAALMLRAQAARLRPPVRPASVMTTPQVQGLAALRAVEADGFDRLFIDQQVRAHERTAALLTLYAAEGSEPRLRALARASLPQIEQHLEAARALQAPKSEAEPAVNQE